MNYHSCIKKSAKISLAKNIVYNFVLSIFLTLIVCVLSIYIFRLKLDVVVGDSMENTFYKDDIIVVKKYDEYYLNDIVEFNAGVSEPITHRIVEKQIVDEVIEYRTQGDANPTPEAYTITYEDINGKVIAIIKNGNKIYKYFKENYIVFIDVLLGVWALTYIVNGELEMRGQNILNVE